MKYTNSDLAHAWAHQHDEEASNHGGTFFFDGLKIYSYGYHFPIARLLPVENVVLFTTANYSTTTSQHMALVKRAIGEHLTVIYVSDVEPVCDREVFMNYEKRLETIHETIKKASRARQNKLLSFEIARVDSRFSSS